MKQIILLLVLTLVACEDRRHCPPAPPPRECPTLPVPCPSMTVPETQPLASAVRSAAPPAPSASASTSAPPASSAWELVTEAEFSHLVGTWISETNGDSHAAGKLKPGGVRVEFAKATGKTPYKLKFWAPKDGHMDHKTVSGGCGFYSELHEKSYYTAFCRGYGVGADKGEEQKLFLEFDADLRPGEKLGDRLRLKIGDLVEAVLVRRK